MNTKMISNVEKQTPISKTATQEPLLATYHPINP